MKVLVDSSFLLHCADKGKNYVSVLEEKIGDKIEFVVPEEVIGELKRMASMPWKKAMLAKVALNIVRDAEILPRRFQTSVDQSLILHASITHYPVLTVDANLMRRLAVRGLDYLSVSLTGKPIVRLKFR